MTARAIGAFALVLAIASPALAGPANSVIGGKKLQEDMVHSGGVGYPSIMYEWWNKGKGKLDWGLSGELVYGDWAAAHRGKFTKIGLGINGLLRWNLATREHSKVTNDIAIFVRPGILIGSSTGSVFLFGLKGEVGAPVSIDVHERVSVVVGGYIPFVGYFFKGGSKAGEVPLLVRMGVEIDAADKVAPWFFFDLGPTIAYGGGGSSVDFAWRIGAGTAFWGVLGNGGDKSDSAATASAEPVE